jgi:hypothetical protein
VAVVFNTDLAEFASHYGNCFLKNSIANPILGQGNTYAAAKLVAD